MLSADVETKSSHVKRASKFAPMRFESTLAFEFLMKSYEQGVTLVVDRGHPQKAPVFRLGKRCFTVIYDAKIPKPYDKCRKSMLDASDGSADCDTYPMAIHTFDVRNRKERRQTKETKNTIITPVTIPNQLVGSFEETGVVFLYLENVFSQATVLLFFFYFTKCYPHPFVIKLFSNLSQNLTYHLMNPKNPVDGQLYKTSLLAFMRLVDSPLVIELCAPQHRDILAATKRGAGNGYMTMFTNGRDPISIWQRHIQKNDCAKMCTSISGYVKLLIGSKSSVVSDYIKKDPAGNFGPATWAMRLLDNRGDIEDVVRNFDERNVKSSEMFSDNFKLTDNKKRMLDKKFDCGLGDKHHIDEIRRIHRNCRSLIQKSPKGQDDMYKRLHKVDRKATTFKAFHDDLVTLYADIEDEVSKVSQSVPYQFYWFVPKEFECDLPSEGKMRFVRINNQYELRKLGRTLHNCVATYHGDIGADGVDYFCLDYTKGIQVKMKVFYSGVDEKEKVTFAALFLAWPSFSLQRRAHDDLTMVVLSSKYVETSLNEIKKASNKGVDRATTNIVSHAFQVAVNNTVHHRPEKANEKAF